MQLVTQAQKRDLGISYSDLARVKTRCQKDGLQVLGLRFTNDQRRRSAAERA